MERGRWRNRILPAWFPRAQTNKFAEKINDIVAAVLQGRVPISYRPATDDPQDQAAADIGERLRDLLYEEPKIDDKEEELARWMVTTGNSFILPYYDNNDRYGTVPVEGVVCQKCQNFSLPLDVQQNGGVCPACKQSNQFQNATQDFPIGSLNADVCSPFEIRLDHRIRIWEEQRRFVRIQRYDLDYAKELWPDYADDIKPDYGNDLSQYYLDVLSHITGSFSASGGFIGGAPFSPKNPKVTAYHFYELPSEDFPDGLKVLRIGQGSVNVVEKDELPTQYGAGTKKGQKFLPLVHFGFDVQPGRFWNKTRMDDLVPMQMFRNTIEANLRLTCQRMGNSIWLNPKGSGFTGITGEPGQEIAYNPISMGGTNFAKPERIPAELGNVQPMIILINLIDEHMERVAGTAFLQGGNAPPGVTAASALAYLGEKSQKAMSPLMRSWAKGWKNYEEMQLEIARDNWDDTRLRVIAGKNKKWQVEKFQKADLQGAVNLVIDYNSLFPKSQATQRATIEQLVQMGVINPVDPEQGWRILQAFGETEIKGSINIDVDEAIKEADYFMTKGQQPELIPLVQNSTVHLLQHTDFAKTDEFKDLPQDQKQIWYDHIKATVADIVARQVAFKSVGVDPNEPILTEVSSAEAQIAAAATQNMSAQMGGGAGAPNPNGPGAAPGEAKSPDQLIGANGKFQDARKAMQGQPTPDIAAAGLPTPAGMK